MHLFDETLSFVHLYVTSIHIHENYIHYKRAEECLERLFFLENQMIQFIDTFQNTCLLFFTPDIGPEWLHTYFMKPFREVQRLITFLERNLRSQNTWPQRPSSKTKSRIVVKRRNVSLLNYRQVY